MPTYLIEASYTPGANLYAVIHNPDGTVWDAIAEDWVAYVEGDWANYAIALTELGASGYYKATLPDVGNVLTTEAIYLRQGGSPAVSDAPPQAMGQSRGVNVASINGNFSSAIKQAAAIQGVVVALVETALSAASLIADLPSTQNNAYVGRRIMFTTGTLTGEVSTISAYNATTGLLTFDSLTSTPSVNDEFAII